MAQTLKVDPLKPEPGPIEHAASIIRAGQVVAIPTDTVYGLAADPFNAAAVERIFTIKGRPPDAPVLALVDSLEMAAALSKHLPPLFDALAKQFWPGPLTMVVDASRQVPGIVTANTGRIGMRWPAAAIPLALIRAVGGPITATSANRSGEKECRSAADVNASLGDRLSLILDGGPSGAVRPSTVVSLSESGWEPIREGAIARSTLEEFFATQSKSQAGTAAQNKTSG